MPDLGEMPQPDHTLHYFIHVPKTAGVSVRAWLARVFERDEILFIYPGAIDEAPDGHTYSFEQVAREAHRLLASFRVFFGHYPFNPDWFVRPDCRGLGFVREPRARVVSWYRYVLRNAERLPGPRMEKIAAAVRAGRTDLGYLYEQLEIEDLDNSIVRYFSCAGVPIGGIDERHVDRAIENVERHFDFVGHVDHFEASMQEIAHVLGRPYEASQAKNVSPGRSSASIAGDLDRDLIDELTRYDRAFVDYVEGRFFARRPRR